MSTEESKLCPSATCSTTASLLGIVQENKQVRLLEAPVKLSDEFIQRAQEHGEPSANLFYSQDMPMV